MWIPGKETNFTQQSNDSKSIHQAACNSVDCMPLLHEAHLHSICLAVPWSAYPVHWFRVVRLCVGQPMAYFLGIVRFSA